MTSLDFADGFRQPPHVDQKSFAAFARNGMLPEGMYASCASLE